MDLLGLKNLTLIDRAVQLIKQNHGIDLDVTKLPLDDAKTFQLICEGKTSGVFQLESDGLKEVLRKLQPNKFEDIIAVNALYRPGPLGSGMVDDFIERRHGRQNISYIFKELEPILQETYGVIVYQEQVMKIASAVAGYSLGEADILRRAMGKKKAEVMEEQRKIFLEKAKEQHFDDKKSGELFDLMAYFAGYGFNKSHSAAYALIAYQTAFLKANYTPEFMACLISLEATNSESMSLYLQEARHLGLTIIPPDINLSNVAFSVVRGEILFGLQGIKNVGLAALENIIQEQAKEPFKDLFDFCMRIDLRTANKRVIENLIYAGAFDRLPGNRAQKVAELTPIIDRAIERKRSIATGQMGLFGTVQDDPHHYEPYIYQSISELPDKDKLEKEKEVIGFYLSAHPLESYRKQLEWFSPLTFAETVAKSQQHTGMQELSIISCGIIKGKRNIITKKGDPMAFVQLEDAHSSAEIILFPKLFKKVSPWLDVYQLFVVKGSVDLTAAPKCKIKANEFVPLDLIWQEWPTFQKMILKLPHTFDEQFLQELQALLPGGAIPLEFRFHEQGTALRLMSRTRVAIDTERLESLEKRQITGTIVL
jgi:DNA polymerase-3 subunit alpha